MDNLLNQAKQCQINSQWKKATELFREHLKQNPEEETEVYVNYARCLRFVGQTKISEEILLERQELCSGDMDVLEELYHLYNSLRKYELAKPIVTHLITLKPTNATYYFYRGRVNSFLNERELAKEDYMLGLEYKYNMDINDLKKEIQKDFTDELNKVKTVYEYIGGKNNFGAFIHQYYDQEYFTKISINVKSSEQEVKFYKNLTREFPELRKIAPSYICSKKISNLVYLTIDKVNTTAIDDKDTIEVIKTSQIITNIKYKDIMKSYTPPKYSFILENRPVSIMKFFTKIHEKKCNEKLFHSLYQLLEQNSYPNEIQSIISRLESYIMENHLYIFIKPDVHYSFLHGDFIPSNIRKSKKDGSIIVLDWALYKIGPHFLDLAKFFSAPATPYSEVKRIYLDNNQLNNNLSLIEKIFFIYALILLYLLRLTEKHVEGKIDECLLPALYDLEKKLIDF